MEEITGRKLVELSYDIQSGLGNTEVPHFGNLREMGIAATLAVHLKGLPEIEYEVLRAVSDYYFNIPSLALKGALNILEDIEYVKLHRKGRNICKVMPQVPRFKDLYEGIGDYFTFSEMNEHEQATLVILSKLQNKPENRNRILTTTGIDNATLDSCIKIGQRGNYFKEYRKRGKDILASPFYFADNLDGLADLSARVGSEDISKVLDVIRRNQGWPLSMALTQGELGGTKLTDTQKMLVLQLCSEGILKPPSIKFNNQQESFIFTPKPGNKRLDATNREIYERAMALVSSVRKGQLLADNYKIKYPVAILRKLRDSGYIGANSEAQLQYRNLVVLKVGFLVKIDNERCEFRLDSDQPENIEAVNLAISLLETGDLANMDVNKEAQLALSKDETYIQSIISSAELKNREIIKLDESATEQFEQLILGIS